MANRIPEDFIQTVLEKTDIVEVIKQRVQLKKQGQRFSACCPFHNEKTPSFTVHPQKQFFHCFGCGTGGNVISFLIEYDKLGFRDVIENLAHAAGLDMPENHSTATENNFDELYPINEKIGQFYASQLTHHPIAIDYLKNKRQLTGLTAKTFALGYAPEGWHTLLSQFPSEQHPLLLQVGAIKQKNNRFYDAFRQRIIFPIRNARGKTVGFGGRSLDGAPPKYLNSPETDIFHKNYELYGLHEALQHCRKLDEVVVVEGYMDVVSLHQHGLPSAVATLGTAVNETHIKKLLRYVSNITFCFDGDNAGKKASFKAMVSSLPLLRDGICFKVLYLPDKLDPDDFCQQHGVDAFKERLQAAPELPMALLRQLKQQHAGDTMAAKASFADEAKKLINTMPNGIYKELLFEKLASIIKMPLEQLERQHQQAPRQPHHNNKPAPTRTPASSVKMPQTLTIAAAILIQNPDLFEAHKQDILPLLDSIPSQHFPPFATLIDILQQHNQLNTGSLLQQCPEEFAPLFLSLASKPILIPAEGYLDELKGALKRVIERYEKNLTRALIQKSQQSPLSEEEKSLLNRLLQNKHKKLLES